ncbi:bifunctional ADP-dependent NAD(P)H-hydrate dehydratase/NAD(P)H-hydrate epimerase [Angustibacter speluncae]
MIDAYSVADVRAAEERAMAALPDGALMQRAAAGLAAELVRELCEHAGGVYGRRVVLLVGPGSNGGDALWAGARLVRRGVQVTAVLTSESVHAQGLAALRTAGGRVVDVAAPLDDVADAVGRADVVVDGLLGIGGRPGLRGRAAELADVLDGSRVVAVDLPSGVAPDTGATSGPHVVADVTVTFGAVKPATVLPPGEAASGELRVVDIGLDVLGDIVVKRMEPDDVAHLWPHARSDDDKYSRGVVGVVAGGATYTGAAVLATGAAVRSGAGMVRYLGPGAATDLVRARWPEVVPGPGRVQAWVLGPGVDPDDAGQAEHVRAAVAGEEPCLVDAGALGLLPDLLRDDAVRAPLLLTPHAGELARLLTDLGHDTDRAAVEDDPLAHARRAAERTGATVLLKGAVTLVVPPDGPVLSQADGPAWLATAGSGDVLSGVVGTLLAAGLDPSEAGALGALVHGRAGWTASGGGPVSAGAVLDAIPATLRELLVPR